MFFLDSSAGFVSFTLPVNLPKIGLALKFDLAQIRTGAHWCTLLSIYLGSIIFDTSRMQAITFDPALGSAALSMDSVSASEVSAQVCHRQHITSRLRWDRKSFADISPGLCFRDLKFLRQELRSDRRRIYINFMINSKLILPLEPEPLVL
jgi:hypothetical protein